MKDKNFQSYHQAIYYLRTLYNFEKIEKFKISAIKRMQIFLQMLGNPEKKIKIIHVAGTSGKGSVCSMIHNGLTLHGINNGMFTSPHTITAIERISVNNLYIPPQKFAQILEDIKPKIRYFFQKNKDRLSYSEITLAIALIYFKEQNCKYAIIETGCGGRFDYTNSLNNKILQIITNIGLDHESILGKNKSQIAWHKAGIITKAPTITSKTSHQILKIIKDEARIHNSHLIITGKNNKDIAKESLNLLNIPPHITQKALNKIYLPARLEMVQNNPKVIIDGAHNPDKMQKLVDYLKNLTYKKLFIIIGFTHNKNSYKMISVLKPIIKKKDKIFITRFKNSLIKAINPWILKRQVNKKLGINPTIFLDAEDALDKAIKNAKQQDLIIITGSLYLAGELRKHWYSEEFILKNRYSIK